MVGSGGCIYEVYDGGESFNDLFIFSIIEELLMVVFVDSILGYVVGCNGILVEIWWFYVEV